MTMPQTRHYEMKDSGVEWIGKMPSHWNTLRLQKIYRIKKDIAGTAGYTVLSVTQHGIKPKNMDSKGQFALDYSKYQLVKSGDFVMNHMDLLTGWVDISKYDGVTSPDYRVFTSIANCQNTFFKYIFQFCYMNRVFYGLGQGVADVGRWRLPADMFRKFMLPVPPLPEQTAIAAYLDEKCATIDAIITEAKASIEEYKSWKASVIFETVTKGLNPNAEMKDSGVEWIGEIPKGWKIVPAKFFMRVQAGYPFDSERFDNSQGIPLIRIRDITSGHTETFYNGDYPEEYVVHNNDLLVGMDGDFNVRWWQGGEAVLNQRCCRIFAQKGLILRYFYFLLPFYLKQVNELAYSTTVKHLANGDIGNADICLPPEDEQTAIAAYLDSKCAAIDGIILEKEELIKELENYKRSLIFEVVTGKRRVC